MSLNKITWGYCEPCNREVPIDGEGNLTAHLGVTEYLNARKLCSGSLEPPFPSCGPENVNWSIPFQFTAKQIAIPPNKRRPRDPGVPVMDVFGHPLHEVAERFKKEAAEAARKKERLHGRERG